MSDEFIELATHEINQEISDMFAIMNSCKTNDDVIQKASIIERHTHKIKGLAPMMGKEDLGELAAVIDTVLKRIIDGKNISFFDELSNSISLMKTSMDSSCDLSEIKTRINAILNSCQS